MGHPPQFTQPYFISANGQHHPVSMQMPLTMQMQFTPMNNKPGVPFMQMQYMPHQFYNPHPAPSMHQQQPLPPSQPNNLYLEHPPCQQFPLQQPAFQYWSPFAYPPISSNNTPISASPFPIHPQVPHPMGMNGDAPPVVFIPSQHIPPLQQFNVPYHQQHQQQQYYQPHTQFLAPEFPSRKRSATSASLPTGTCQTIQTKKSTRRKPTMSHQMTSSGRCSPHHQHQQKSDDDIVLGLGVIRDGVSCVLRTKQQQSITQQQNREIQYAQSLAYGGRSIGDSNRFQQTRSSEKSSFDVRKRGSMNSASSFITAQSGETQDGEEAIDDDDDMGTLLGVGVVKEGGVKSAVMRVGGMVGTNGRKWKIDEDDIRRKNVGNGEGVRGGDDNSCATATVGTGCEERKHADRKCEELKEQVDEEGQKSGGRRRRPRGK
ncbi:hypothetical protein BDR26DRAFT_869920 [Obelidium mucronatum]|nr:hypothetical protein BDR26DRAFT_869920 [Obelidium mucronatum]